ncbi:MAG: hypothetical protein GY737_04065 [Desulfobacteraceae bacterium]|nr:hypothetical protein [Desulfobacteraceae bacterium]
MEKGSLDKTKKSSVLDTKKKREIAKYGMAVSMGTLLITGFTKGKESSVLHVGSGLTLLGFSYWHYNLYQSKKQKG